ncbi:MAG: 2-hydroxychromene-2-carboxylate isomerase [Azospirillum sp.]|nr:2-hydroxychromene-2-carboxylate isomerase [Azospirillum sp.]
MSAPLDFYFDFASPYGYFASLTIDALAARHGRAVTWRPILLGAVFKITGVQPNMHQPLRGAYLGRDTQRWARLTGAPFCIPEVMPLNAVHASRAYYWLAARDTAAARRFAKAIYHGHWAEGRDLGALAAVVGVAATLGLDGEAIAAGAQEPETKQKLRDETDRAIARGVFGAPFIFVDDEPFWGNDRLGQIEQWLERGGW